jgi:hypothetical protein
MFPRHDGPDTEKTKSIFVPNKKLHALAIGVIIAVALFLCDLLGFF